VVAVPARPRGTILVGRRVVDEHLEQEAVELRLGRRGPSNAARDAVRGMLSKRAYIGETDWGHEKVGYYNVYEGPVLNEPTRHPAIIDREEAQMRFANEDQRTREVTRKGRTPCLLSGFLRCAACGSLMHGHRPRPGGSVGEYVCGARISSPGECHEPSCSLRRAEEAVLREVARLQATKGGRMCARAAALTRTQGRRRRS
jgi:hypothetical protein